MHDNGSPRVLHLVASRQRRGAEVFASDLVGELARRDVPQRVTVIRDQSGERVGFDAPTAVLGAGYFRPLRVDPRAILRLRHDVRSWGAQVVQAHGGEALKYALAATHRRECRVAYRRIGSTLDGTLGFIRSAGHQRLVRRAAVVIAVSQAAGDEMVQRYGVPQRRVVVIPNAVDVARTSPTSSRSEMRKLLQISESSELIVSVGALNWEKDPVGQIDVFERVARQRPRALLAMAGSGPLEDETRREIVRRGLTDRIVLLGSREDIPNLLAAGDVLLLASKTEGMPGVAIEAGLAGLPVAAYALSGVPEVVAAGSTGLLAPPGNVERLAKCITDLLENVELRTSMGATARERCIREFSIPPIADRYLEIYRRLARFPDTTDVEAAR